MLLWRSLQSLPFHHLFLKSILSCLSSQINVQVLKIYWHKFWQTDRNSHIDSIPEQSSWLSAHACHCVCVVGKVGVADRLSPTQCSHQTASRLFSPIKTPQGSKLKTQPQQLGLVSSDSGLSKCGKHVVFQHGLNLLNHFLKRNMIVDLLYWFNKILLFPIIPFHLKLTRYSCIAAILPQKCLLSFRKNIRRPGFFLGNLFFWGFGSWSFDLALENGKYGKMFEDAKSKNGHKCHNSQASKNWPYKISF